MKLFIYNSKKIISAIIVGVIIAIISTLIIDFIYEDTGPDETVIFTNYTKEKQSVPQLWSHHRWLTISVDECSSNAVLILGTLGFQSIVKNKHYVYGNLNGIRATIKCVDMAKASFVYTAVAGADVKLVEKLRNEIAWKL
ncbi:MAG: hypothetical protein HRU23_19675 [Gammaproteobacteria bacterium]|nr:hypothetical protein [Gammaproteobacteria bacterium]